MTRPGLLQREVQMMQITSKSVASLHQMNRKPLFGQGEGSRHPGRPTTNNQGCLLGGHGGGVQRLEVADAGQGVPATDLPHLFDKYYRVHTPDSASRGSGLGLAICRGIICAHGGRIWVESAEGQGARFCFTLPALTPEPEARS